MDSCSLKFISLFSQGASSVKPHRSIIKVIAISVSLIFGILLLSCICCFLRKRKRRRHGVKDKSNEMDGENSLELPLVDFHTIVSATNNFSAENKLGEGGFGHVYKGKLGEDQEVAVKRLCKTSQQGVDEFRNEVMLIAKLQHRNLLRLLGCCIYGEERMLIYEYMPSKSLDAFLFEFVDIEASMEPRSMAPEGLSKMKMGTPFALLRGYLTGTTVSIYQMADVQDLQVVHQLHLSVAEHFTEAELYLNHIEDLFSTVLYRLTWPLRSRS